MTAPDPQGAPVGALANLIVHTLLDVRPRERLLLVVDRSGRSENGDIADAISRVAAESDAETFVVDIDDAPGDGTEYLPEAVARMMRATDIVISLTLTTSAPFPHHEVPIGLVRSGRIRGVFMAKRRRAGLLGRSVLHADFPAMDRVATTWQSAFEATQRVRVTTAAGTDFTASLAGQPSRRSQLAHRPGTMSPVNWGEVYQGPVPGTANGIVVVDGPVLGFGWPASPIAIELRDGLAVGIEGDDPIADALWDLARSSRNGTNVAEVAVGINAYADDPEVNVYKKGLGRLHIALGSGVVYDQDVDSPIHVDCILERPTVQLDDGPIITDGVAAPIDDAVTT